METKSQNHAFNDTSTSQGSTTSHAPSLPLVQLDQTPANDDNDGDLVSEYLDDLTGEPVEFYATKEQVAAIQSQSILRSALKISGSVLVLAFISVFVLWYRLVFEFDSTTTLQTLAILVIALVQTSIFANTLIVLASVIHGKLGGQLQIMITPSSSNTTCRESLLFSDALCQGSYKASLGVVVAMLVAMAYQYTKVPVVFDTIVLSTLALFFVANLVSIVAIKAAHNKIKAALLVVKKDT